MGNIKQSDTGEPDGCFRTTHWTVVLEAKNGASANSAESLQSLCETYWPPIYAYLRRQGYNSADAEDLCQGFFEHLLEQDFLNHLRHQNGKFRSFLLTFLKNFLSDIRAKASAQKRGGGRGILSLEQLQEEERRIGELPDSAATPERLFERRWAERLMQRAV